jgi:hypothetical protein
MSLLARNVSADTTSGARDRGPERAADGSGALSMSVSLIAETMRA